MIEQRGKKDKTEKSNATAAGLSLSIMDRIHKQAEDLTNTTDHMEHRIFSPTAAECIIFSSAHRFFFSSRIDHLLGY